MQTIDTDAKVDGAVAVHDVLEAFFASRREAAAKVNPYYEELWQEIERLMHAGGKRLRSRMVILSYCLFGGTDVRAIAPAAAAQELLHLAMLIHDDIIDRDYIRYGVDNISGGYLQKYKNLVGDVDDRLHFAQGASVLAGDLLLSESYLVMAQANVEAEKILSIQQLLGQGVFEVVGGELLDTELTFRGAGAISPEVVALYKTASYTFVLPFLVGARLAGASEDVQAAIRTFGRHLGIAFQLRDDIIGVFGDEGETGKTTIGDIREGKRTYMVESFYRLATPEQQAEFDTHFGNPLVTHEEAAIVKELLVTTGALRETEAYIDRHEALAREALVGVSMNPEYLDELNTLITIVIKRTA